MATPATTHMHVAGCGLPTIMRPNFNAGALLQSYGYLEALGPAFNMDQECLNSVGRNLQICLQDILTLDGCCSEECWLFLRSEAVRRLDACLPLPPVPLTHSAITLCAVHGLPAERLRHKVDQQQLHIKGHGAPHGCPRDTHVSRAQCAAWDGCR